MSSVAYLGCSELQIPSSSGHSQVAPQHSVTLDRSNVALRGWPHMLQTDKTPQCPSPTSIHPWSPTPGRCGTGLAFTDLPSHSGDTEYTQITWHLLIRPSRIQQAGGGPEILHFQQAYNVSCAVVAGCRPSSKQGSSGPGVLYGSSAQQSPRGSLKPPQLVLPHTNPIRISRAGQGSMPSQDLQGIPRLRTHLASEHLSCNHSDAAAINTHTVGKSL